ncbi:MAG: two-component regulator propeller domain-containing protein [Bacteroidota bacterium]
MNRIIATSLMLITGIIGYSQNGLIDLRFNSIQEDLTQNTVTCIKQDSKGFLWVGTRNGLNRYDGLNMIHYESEAIEEDGISGEITAIHEDKQGVLWVGTTIRGLYRYVEEEDKFLPFSADSTGLNTMSEDYVTSIYEDEEGGLWIGTPNRGLNYLNKERTQFKHFLSNSDDPFSISGNWITEVIGDHKGNIWVGTRGAGLNLYNRDNKRFIHYSHDPNNSKSINSNIIESISRGQNGDLWVATSLGLNRLSYNDQGLYEFENIVYDNMFRDKQYNVVLSVLEDNKGRLWIGTENGGLIVKDTHKKSTKKYIYDIESTHGLTGNSIWSIYEDDRGFIWIGTFNEGLFKVSPIPEKFRHIKSNLFNPNSLSHNAVTCFAEDTKGNVWIGTDGGGINYWNRGKNTFDKYNASSDEQIISDQVLSMMYDVEGNLWVGFWEGGIRILRKGSDTFEAISNSQNAELRGGSIFDLMQDSKGRIWIAAHSNGVILYDPKSGNTESFMHDDLDPSSISEDFIVSILEDADKNIWIGTDGGGLDKFMESKEGAYFEHYDVNFNKPHQLSDNRISCLFEDSNNKLWVGTPNKLNFYDKVESKFLRVGKEKGLLSQVISSVLEDQYGDLWLGTHKGLAKFNPESLESKFFSKQDGLQSNEFNRQSCLRLSSGELLFGGINGFNIFHPDNVQTSTFRPQAYLARFNLSNGAKKSTNSLNLPSNLNTVNEINLTYDQNSFNFDFGIISFSQSSQNSFAFKLENHDNDWQYVGNQRSALYTSVPPGEYIFKVMATNSDGVWNDDIASIRVNISPAWYDTYWAYAVYFLIVGLIVWRIIAMIINRERLSAQYQVEHIELAKMQELNEMKSRFFANISHEFRSPLTLILGPLKSMRHHAESDQEKERIELMIRNAESLLGLINELLELSKLESGKMSLEATENDLNEFLKPIIKSFSTIADKKYINYKINLPQKPLDIYFDREKLEKIIVNLLSNAFKYTPEFGTIGLSVEKKNKQVVIQVSDSGVGVPKEDAKYIFNRYYRVNNRKTARNEGTGIGLSLTHELVHLHGGRIELLNSEVKGATFRVMLPLGKAHLQPDQIVNKTEQEVESFKELYQDSTELDSKSMSETIDQLEDQMNDLPIVLLVEDHADIRNYICKVLEEEYHVVMAKSGEEGLEQAKNQIPDLVISDVMMPGMDGFQLCKQLKQDIKTSHIPVILLTAKASVESSMEGFEHGADYYITKPFNPKMLMLRANNIIKTRDQIKEKLLNNDSLEISPKKIVKRSKDQDFLDLAISIVEKNISNSDFFVDDLGKELGLSRMQLYRKLKAMVGKSANEFIRFIRLKRAAQLLDEGRLNISEITYEVGFNDLKYFRDCFKKQYGLNPSEYQTRTPETNEKAN